METVKLQFDKKFNITNSDEIIAFFDKTGEPQFTPSQTDFLNDLMDIVTKTLEGKKYPAEKMLAHCFVVMSGLVKVLVERAKRNNSIANFNGLN